MIDQRVADLKKANPKIAEDVILYIVYNWPRETIMATLRQ